VHGSPILNAVQAIFGLTAIFKWYTLHIRVLYGLGKEKVQWDDTISYRLTAPGDIALEGAARARAPNN